MAFGMPSCKDTGSSGESAVITDTTAEDEYLAEYESERKKWGFINQEGRVIIKARFDQVSVFTEGLAAVNSKGRWGYINHDAEVVIPYAYLAVWPFTEGRGRVSDFEGAEFFVDATGKEIRPDPSVDHVFDFHNGRARMEAFGQYGYLDLAGATVIEPVYENAWDFEFGLARVRKDGLEGLIDTSGNYVVEPVYDRAYASATSLYLVKKDGKFFFIDAMGERHSTHTYLAALPFEMDGIAAVKDDSGWYLVDRDENRITEMAFTVMLPLGNSRWAGRDADAYALLGSSGETFTEHKYQQINKFSEGLAVYRRDELCGFLDTGGNEVLPPQYGLAWDFGEGLARAAFRDGIAYIDKQGRVPFIPRHNELRDFSEGLAPFQER